jgi:spatacsin
MYQGDCHWAKWLLFSRLKGYEYEASFSNAHWKLLRNLGSDGSGNFMEIEEKINIIDVMIAEGVGEMAALATLMYATFPIENCLSLETLDRPSLREYPTMRKALISACSDGDHSGSTNASRGKHFIIFFCSLVILILYEL